MDRRAVLRVVALGATGVSGCLGGRSDEETTTTGATTTTVETPTTDTTEETTDIGDCPASVIPGPRRHVHSNYGLGIVRDDTEEPAVAVVGEEWRSVLRTNEMSDADWKFVSDTDFEAFVVLVVQYRKASGGHDLRVTDVGIDGDVLLADVCVVTDGATNDAPTANLFVRIPYSGSPTTRARVSIHRPRETVTATSE